jgi:hypothetical protein
MQAPYDVLWNGKVYATGETIPASEKKLIAALGVSPVVEAAEDLEDAPAKAAKVK